MMKVLRTAYCVLAFKGLGGESHLMGMVWYDGV